MAEPSAPSVRSTVDPRASEDVRRFMQERLALLGLVTLALSGGFLLVAALAEMIVGGTAAIAAHLSALPRLLNLGGAAISLAVYLVARAGRRGPTALLVLDAIGTVCAVVPYTLMSVLGQHGVAGVFLTALTVMLVLQTRALLVPSDARRTFGISLAAIVLSMSIALGIHVSGRAPSSAEPFANLVVTLTLWQAVILAVSTLSSAVLFGLRQEVSEVRRQLGQYTLGDRIGAGGMGEVYRASHAMLRRPTAVKLLPREKAGEAAIARFEREVQLTASLTHPNTITIFDYGHTPDGVFYYAMEYLEGGDLEAIVSAAGPMPQERVVHVLAQVAAGLAEAHGIGLIHRDIKPANIVLVGRPAVADLAKLLDFGLVRELEQRGALTRADTLMGTPLYMAPESITDPDNVDPRSDLYALGAVGYYLLTGEHVFSGKTVVEVCSHHLHSDPVPPRKRSGRRISEALEEVILRCLAKDPADRPASASELRELLLACEDVGAWTDRDAFAWWEEHRHDVVKDRKTAPPDGAARTIAVDAAKRA